MHRFFSGVPIANEDRLRELLYPVTKEQLSYVCYRSTWYQYADFQDVIGAVHSKHWNMVKRSR